MGYNRHVSELPEARLNIVASKLTEEERKRNGLVSPTTGSFIETLEHKIIPIEDLLRIQRARTLLKSVLHRVRARWVSERPVPKTPLGYLALQKYPYDFESAEKRRRLGTDWDIHRDNGNEFYIEVHENDFTTQVKREFADYLCSVLYVYGDAIGFYTPYWKSVV